VVAVKGRCAVAFEASALQVCAQAAPPSSCRSSVSAHAQCKAQKSAEAAAEVRRVVRAVEVLEESKW